MEELVPSSPIEDIFATTVFECTKGELTSPPDFFYFFFCYLTVYLEMDANTSLRNLLIFKLNYAVY